MCSKLETSCSKKQLEEESSFDFDKFSLFTIRPPLVGNTGMVTEGVNRDEENGETQESDTDKPPWVEYCMIGLVVIGVLINLRVISIVGGMPRLKRRSRAIPLLLVVHLAIITIGISANVLLDAMEEFNTELLSKRRNYQGRWPHSAKNFCGLWKFWETILLSIFPMNVVEIIHQRIRCSEVIPLNLNGAKWVHLPMAFWTVALICSIPTGYMYDADQETGKCIPIQLFDSLWITSFYQLTRFQIFHVATCAYVIHALVKIYSKVRRIHNVYHRPPIQPRASTSRTRPTPSPQPTFPKFRSIHFVYVYLTSYIIIWFTYGIYFFLQLLHELPLHPGPLSSNLQSAPIPPKGIPKSHLLIFGFIFISPYLTYRLIDGVSWCICGRTDIVAYPLGDAEEEEEEDQSDIAAGRRRRREDSENIFFSSEDLVLENLGRKEEDDDDDEDTSEWEENLPSPPPPPNIPVPPPAPIPKRAAEERERKKQERAKRALSF